MRCLVLGARRFSFPRDDGSGRQEGTTIYYLAPEDQEVGGDMSGLFPFQVNGGPSLFHQLPQLPGEYELRMGRRPGARNKSQEVVLGVEFVRGVSVGDGYSAPTE